MDVARFKKFDSFFSVTFFMRVPQYNPKPAKLGEIELLLKDAVKFYTFVYLKLNLELSLVRGGGYF